MSVKYQLYVYNVNEHVPDIILSCFAFLLCDLLYMFFHMSFRKQYLIVCDKYIMLCMFLTQIPLVLHKEADVNERGQQMLDADGKLRYRCGFRIGGGIDQDPTVSPQRYPDKALSCF